MVSICRALVHSSPLLKPSFEKRLVFIEPFLVMQAFEEYLDNQGIDVACKTALLTVGCDTQEQLLDFFPSTQHLEKFYLEEVRTLLGLPHRPSLPGNGPLFLLRSQRRASLMR